MSHEGRGGANGKNDYLRWGHRVGNTRLPDAHKSAPRRDLGSYEAIFMDSVGGVSSIAWMTQKWALCKDFIR